MKQQLLCALSGLVAIAFFSFSPGPARALSDADYARFIKTSPQFAQADKRLKEVWAKAQEGIAKERFPAVLEAQRAWLASGRDAEASAKKAQGLPPAEAYAVITEERARIIEGFLASGEPAIPAGTPPLTEMRAPVLTGSPANAQLRSEGAAPPAPEASGPNGASADNEANPEKTQPGSEQNAAGAAGTAGKPQPKPAQTVVSGKITGMVPQNITGEYTAANGSIEIRALPGGFNVTAGRADPEGRWLCSAEGRGMLEGNTLIFTDRENPEAGPVLVTIEGNKLIITEPYTALCGEGGSFAAVYLKKR